MPWLRIDDNETDHPKVIGLIELAGYEAYYRLHKLRGYCARLRTGGHFTRAAAKAVGVKPKMISAMIQVGLVDDNDGDLCVHDWDEYNPSDPTAADRMRRHRRNATRNGTVTEGVTEPSLDRNANGPSRAAARARPVPNPTPKLKATAAGSTQDAAKTDAAAALTQLGITDPTLHATAAADPDRALACATAARARATANPAGLYRRIFDAGEWPTDPAPPDEVDPDADRKHPCGLPNCPLRFHTADEAQDHRTYAHITIPTNGTNHQAYAHITIPTNGTNHQADEDDYSSLAP